MVLATVLLLVSFHGLADGEYEESVGTYEADGRQKKLGQSDVEQRLGHLTIRAPTPAASLTVNEHFVANELGEYGSHSSFEVNGGKLTTSGSEITFTKFRPSESPIFSMGSTGSVKLADRPMWISVYNEGENLRIKMEDGNVAGQRIYLDASWLADQRIVNPIIHHENGERLNVSGTPDGRTLYFDMPHFSFVIVSPASVDARSKVGPIWINPHDGEIAYEFESARVSIDVPNRLVASEFWIEKEWIDNRIPGADTVNKELRIEETGGKSFYVISLTAAETPGTIIIESTIPWVPICRTAMGTNCTIAKESLITDICLGTTCDVENITQMFDGANALCEATGCTIGPGELLPKYAMALGFILTKEGGICQLLLGGESCEELDETLDELAYTVADLVLMGLDLTLAARGAGGSDEDPQPIPSSDSQTLITEGGGGLWSLSMVPQGLPVIPSSDIIATEFLSFIPNFADAGQAWQTAEYHGSNPPPGYPEGAWRNEEPTYEITDEDLCKAAITLAVLGVFFAASKIGLVVAGAALLVALIACAPKASAGSWAALGEYRVEHGADGSGWEGELLNLPGILSLTTSVTLDDPLFVDLPYGILACPCEGYYEQQNNYLGQDATEREAAWVAHNSFREQLLAPADAEIRLDLEVLTTPHVQNSDYYILGETPFGRILLGTSLDEILVECALPCGSQNILTISSYGEGNFKPGTEETIVEFFGTPGEAVISILGVQVQGFTLNGSLNGDAYIPNLNIDWILPLVEW